MKRLLWGLLLVAGCSQGVEIRPGWTTTKVVGQMKPQEGFILVERQDQTFLPQGETGYLNRSSAELVLPDAEGNYQVEWPTETVSLTLTYIAAGHVPVKRGFDRSLGVGAYESQVELALAANWAEIFYVNLRPYLSQFITESAFQMPPPDQLFLGNWMNQSEEAIRKNETQRN